MPVQDTVNTTTKPQDRGVSDDQKSGPVTQPISAGQEREQAAQLEEEHKVLEKIVSESESIDDVLESKVRSEIKEARLATKEPEIPKEVAASGVKSPSQEASAVIKSLNLPISEREYKKGIHQKVAGAVVDKVVFGVSGAVGLALWVGRKIKLAHKKAFNVVFRKSEGM